MGNTVKSPPLLPETYGNIMITTEQSFYHSSDTIIGKISLRTKMPFKVSYITLEVKGEEKIRCVVPAGDSNVFFLKTGIIL